MAECVADAPGTALPGRSAPAAMTDLLGDARTLALRLRRALHDGDWLDAYLLAAGLGQLADDRLHPDPFLLNRAASYLGGQSSRPARLAGALAGAAAVGASARPGPAGRRLGVARRALAALTLALGGRVLGHEPAAGWSPSLAGVWPAVPALAGEPVRVPACFHSFDQHPDDVRWLVAALRRRYGITRDVPVCVVGVRTSGSYLAPLHAAELRAAGAARAGVLTYRPGRPFRHWERSALARVARAGGLVLVTDDPPGSGASLAATARAVEAAGVPRSRVVLLASLFGSAAGLPPALSAWAAVVQPWQEWSVHARLAPGPVRGALAALAGPGTRIGEVTPLAIPRPAGERGHARARFAVEATDPGTGRSTRRQILAEGAGLGYLGRQAAAVAWSLPGHVPHVYGFADGLLYRDWLPERARPAPAADLAGTVAAYVEARRRALPARPAPVHRMGGRDPVWEVAARLLSRQYGRLAVPSRPLLLDPLVRRLLAHGDPAVVDGKTDHRHWLPDPAAAGGLRKVDFHQRAFGHLDLACYDPVFDLAGAAADPPGPGFEALLRQEYRRVSGRRVDGERWLLYRLAHLWRLALAGDIGEDRRQRGSAAAVHDYLASVHLRGLPPATGPLCAIDLDGVLECDALGYPATSPTGTLVLRALIVHGYRPVLATGRSLTDVRDRCGAFGLPGGVAEYGTVIYHDGEAADVRPPWARELLERIRRDLAAHPGVLVDPCFRHAVRARLAGGPLRREVLAGIPALRDRRVRVIQGEGQTDVTVAGLDKGSGLRALAARMGGPVCAFAVGDSVADLPMLAQAEVARAPRNARFGTAPAGVRLTRRSYQAGLAQACAELLGHRPGGCPACRVPGRPARTRALLAVLDLRAGGLSALPAGTAVLGGLMLGWWRW